MKKLSTIAMLLALASLAAPTAMAFDGIPTTPDSGSTLLLATISVCGIGFLRRFLSK